MKTFLLLLCLLNAALVLQAQNTETDSLKKQLAATTDDHKRVFVLESLSYAYVSAYPDSALQFAVQGLELAKKIQDPMGEAYCINALGNVYFGVGDYPQALEMYLQSLKMKEALSNQAGAIAVTYFNIANVYTEQEDYRHALEYIFKGKQADERAKDSSGIMFDQYSLGNIYSRMGMQDSALYFMSGAQQLAQRLQDKNLIGAILNSYGEIYFGLNHFDQSKRYYYGSIPYAQAINDNEVLASDYQGLAEIFKKQGRFDSSVHYARNALSIAQDAPFLKQVFETSSFLAELYGAQRQYDSAFHYKELSMVMKDSLYNIEKVKKVQKLNLVEQQRQQAIEVAKAAYRNKVKFYSVIAASLIFLVVASVLWRNNKQKQKAYVLLQQQKLKTDQALDELKATQAHLLHKEKMASLGELTAGIAHEIQNPLNFVNNFSELNKELLAELKQEAQSGQIHEVLQLINSLEENEAKINHHGQRADAIVKGMLQHSRAGTGQKEPTNLNTLVEEYLRLAYHGFRAKDKNFKANVQVNFDETIGKIDIAPRDVGQVLLNLFTNAFYAVYEQLKKSGSEYEPTVLVSTQKLENNVEIQVQDNGMGISKSLQQKIFQPFFTTKPTGEGTGLGLSLSYDIVKAHGGELTVESQEGAGATFSISLPLI